MSALTPMIVQALVGLCCVRRNPEAVEITLGDMVLDSAAGKERDVDVTVSVNEGDGRVRAFMAYEVKRERRSIGVATVEQLAAKLADMPSVTHRAIVSASGFTQPAIAKAEMHGVELYAFRPWGNLVEGSPPSFAGQPLPLRIQKITRMLLCWGDNRVYLLVPGGPSSFTWDLEDRAYGEEGQLHAKYKTLGQFAAATRLKSTEILVAIQPVASLLDSMPLDEAFTIGESRVFPVGAHTHTVTVQDEKVFLKFEGGMAQVHSAHISGTLEWHRSTADLDYHIIERVPNGEPYAGAAIAEYGSSDGKMAAFVFAPGSMQVGVHPIVLPEEHRQVIRQLKLKNIRAGQ